MIIAIYGQKINYKDKAILEPFFAEAERKNIVLFIEEKYYYKLKHLFPYLQGQVFSDQLPENVELFVVFGGDGTILSSITYIQNTKIPVVGVNMGRLGFLSSIQKNDFISILPDILEGNYQISERSLLKIECDNKEISFPYALNEVAVIRKETTAMIRIETHVNNKYLNTFWADGLIISTPTGSTGYSLSCGGPIISPNTENFVITPIAPHNLNVRPLIIEDKSEIRLKVISRVPKYLLTLDSRLLDLNVHDELIIKKAPFKIKIIHQNNYSYYDTLNMKLLWGKDTRN